MRTTGKITALPRKLGLESRFCHLFFPLAPFPQDAIFLLRYVATWIFSSRKTHDSTRYSKATRTPICDLKQSWREPWVVYLCEAPKCAMPFMKGLLWRGYVGCVIVFRSVLFVTGLCRKIAVDLSLSARQPHLSIEHHLISSNHQS